MILQIFRPPNDGETLMECKLGDINDAISLQYEKYFCGVGSFTLELPINSPFADKIAANILLYDKQNDDCFIVKNVQDDTKVMRVTGTDLNGILRDRIILPTADAEVSDGKVIVYGSTEYCVKYFVERNFICADANERNVPRLGISENLNRGLEYDTYLASPENAEDVIRTMCEGAKLGYRVRLDVNQTSSEQTVLIFDVSEREDHTAEQDERNRVIFSVGLGNVGTMEREVGITAEKNALWCDTGGAEVFVNKEDGEPPAGWARREEYVSLSVVNPDDGDEVTGAARQVMADKFAVTDSLKIKAGNPLEYGSVYKLGDIVTVYDKAKKAQLDTWISAVAISRKSNENTLSITLGESKPKLLDKYAKQTDILKKNQRDFPIVKYIGTSAGTLTEYNVLSDTSIKYNGTTYTAELADNGLISKITDDQGGEFSPTYADGVADIALHNAAFLAVAMISGLALYDCLTPMCVYRYNTDSLTQDGDTICLINQASSEYTDMFVFTDSTLVGKSIYTKIGADTSYGLLNYNCKYSGSLRNSYDTIYLVAENVITTIGCRTLQLPGVKSSSSTLISSDPDTKTWIFSDAAVGGSVIASTDCASTAKTVIALRINSNAIDIFINGKLIQTGSTNYLTKGSLWFGRSGGVFCGYDSCGFYDFAAAGALHSDAEIVRNSRYLMRKYNIGG